MDLIAEIFLWVGANFTSGVYMYSTKVQGIIWSISDILLVLALLKITGLARARFRKSKIRIRYLFLALSAILTPLLIFTAKPIQIFMIEALVCGIQFCILGYTVVMERQVLLDYVREFTSRQKITQSQL